MKLSLAMIVKNEAKVLERCLRSVKPFVDEMIVVDTGSTDDTRDIADRLGAKVESFSWVDDFSAARNFSVERTSGDWILVLDADEVVTPELGREIRQVVSETLVIGRLRVVSGFSLQGNKMESASYVSRLFPRGGKFEGRIHEQVTGPWPRKNLQGTLRHDGYERNDKSDRNRRLLERELVDAPNDTYLLYQLAVEHASVGKVVEAYACQQRALALLNGTEPYAGSVVVDALYSLLQLRRLEEAVAMIERYRAQLGSVPDFHFVAALCFQEYVRADVQGRIGSLQKVEQHYQRCIQLGDQPLYKSVRGTGSYLAMYNLGLFYEFLGEGAAAQQLYRKAAGLGYAPAAQRLRG